MTGGLDFRSALVLKHDVSRAIAAPGGGPSRSLAHALDYVSRTGEWESKEGIDREWTDEDRELVGRGAASAELGAQLDYVSRMGAWSGKGAGEMVDCSFFGQNGPVSREAVEADMLVCGGCFMRSVVAVRRDDAAALGLEAKEDFERLLRSTWRRSVAGEAPRAGKSGEEVPGSPGWGVTDDPQRVRWVANFHTDHERNLHCHVTTWFADGARDYAVPGDAVTAAGTRDQKRIICREAYKVPLRERLYPEKDFARAMVVARAKVELGASIARPEAARIERLAAAVGAEVDLSPSMLGEADRKALADAAARVTGLQGGEHRGRRAGDWRLGSAARDVHKLLLERSAPYAREFESYGRCVSMEADVNALSSPSSGDGPSAPVVERERARYVREKVDAELVAKRIVPAIERVLSPAAVVERAAREAARAIAPLAAREASLASMGGGADLRSECRRAVSCSERCRAAVSEAVERIKAEVPAAGRLREADLRGRVEEAVSFRASLEARGAVGREARSRVDAVPARAAAAMVRAAASPTARDLGLARSDQARLAAALREVGARTMAGKECGELRDGVAKAIVESPAVRRQILQRAPEVAARLGTSEEAAARAMSAKARERVGAEVPREAVKEARRAFSRAQEPILDNGRGIRGAICTLADLASAALVRDGGRQKRSRGRGGIEREERYVETSRERGR